MLDMYTEQEPRRPLPADYDGTDKSFVEVINQWMKSTEQFGRLRRGRFGQQTYYQLSAPCGLWKIRRHTTSGGRVSLMFCLVQSQLHIVLSQRGYASSSLRPCKAFMSSRRRGQHSAEETKFRGGRSVLERKRSESLVTGTAPLRAAEADVPMADWPAFDALREARRRLTSGARRQAGVPVASDPSVGQLMAHYPKYQEVAADVTQEDWQWSCLEVDKVPENPIVHSGKRH